MKKVIILTQPLRNNYGGLMQAYALQTIVRGLGYDVVTDKHSLNYYKKRKDIYKSIIYNAYYRLIKRKKGFKLATHTNVNINTAGFVRKNIKTIEAFTRKGEPKASLINDYDIYLVGSDQVWRKKYSEICTYFLDFLQDNNKKRISYAASFGLDNIDEYSEEEKSICRDLIKKFDAIGVRELGGVEIVKNEFNREATLVLDPTLLLNKEDYLPLCQKGDNQGNVFRYILDYDSKKKEFCDLFDYKYIDILPKYRDYQKRDLRDSFFKPVGSWLEAFNTCELVVTDSFHGTAFSIIFNKPFVVIANKDRGLDRVQTLLHLFDLEDRLILDDDAAKMKERFLALKPIDFNRVNQRRKELQQQSLSFLKTALEK